MARRSILLSVAFVIAALGTAMVILYVQGIEARATEGQALVEVLTATDVIKGGESVAEAQAAGKFEKTEVVREDMVEGALSSTSSIDDEVAIATIYPGQQVIGQHFGDASDPGDADHPGRQARHQRRAHRPRPRRGLREPGVAGGDLRLGGPGALQGRRHHPEAVARHPAAAPGRRGDRCR